MKHYLVLALFFRCTVDFLLFLAANKLSGRETEPWRLLLAAAVGGLHAAASTVPGLWFLGNHFWQFVAVILMCLTAFETDGGFFRRGALFCLLRFSVDGLVSDGGTISDILWAAVLCALCIYGFRDGMGRERIVPVELFHSGKTVKLKALRDTGNTLRDPVTGEPVMVVDSQVADALTGLNPQQLMHPVETMGTVPGLRLIPYRAVGQPGGMLLALHVKRSRIGKQKGSSIVAFAPQVLDEKGNYQALIGGAV